MLIFLGYSILAARLEPENGKVILGISLTNSLEPIGSDSWTPRESFVSFNQRTGLNWGAFHLVGEIPEKLPPRFELLDQTGTDSALYLSILPTSGWNAVTDQDLLNLAARCGNFNRNGRSVFLRFAPEFNVPWNVWGLQPLTFKRYWNQFYEILRSIPEANRTSMVWAPFEAGGYPFNGSFFPANGSENFKALDTNGDRNITKDDDPYSPFIPENTDSIDWVGLYL